MTYDDKDIIDRLFGVIESRRGKDPETSYVASLFADGRRRIAQKVGEEATETVIAAVARGKEEVAEESADLLFHLMVLWADVGVTPDRVRAVLSRREGQSGLEEKESRESRAREPASSDGRSKEGGQAARRRRRSR